MTDYDFETISSVFNNPQQKLLYIVDHYPYKISDNEKYSQVEGVRRAGFSLRFYNQRNRFYAQESAVYSFIENLWLYSDTEVYAFSNKPHCKKLKHGIQFQAFCNIEKASELRYLTLKATREQISIYFIFRFLESKDAVIIYLEGLYPVAYTDNESSLKALNNLASGSRLHLRPAQR